MVRLVFVLLFIVMLAGCQSSRQPSLKREDNRVYVYLPEKMMLVHADWSCNDISYVYQTADVNHKSEVHICKEPNGMASLHRIAIIFEK